MAQWKPYEDESFWSLDRYRHALLPPIIAKRHFFLPRINRIGLTFPEAVIAAGITAAAIVLGASQRVAEAEESGSTAQLLWIPLFLFITYRSVVRWVTGISFERGMFWHGYLSLLATAYGVWHGVASMYWAELDDDDDDDRMIVASVRNIRGFDVFIRGEDRWTYISGAICSLFMVLMVVTSIHPIRRAMGRIWLWSHHILLIPAVGFAVVHGAPVALVGLAIYIADRLFGYVFQAWFQYRGLREGSGTILKDSGIVKLTLPKSSSFRFSAGQFVCLNIPSVSIFEYHAFTIASAPADEELVFYIKPSGVWSRRLVKRIGNTQQDQGEKTPVSLKVFVHGPVGNVALDWQSTRYNIFVLIGGGIGITPILSIFFHLLQQKKRGRPLKSVRLVWPCSDYATVSDIVSQQFRSDPGNDTTSTSGFSVEVFLTRQAVPDTVETTFGGVDIEWNSGRPTFYKREGKDASPGIFGKVHEMASAEKSTRVAVLACGPETMTADVCDSARKAGNNGVTFDVHLEHFY